MSEGEKEKGKDPKKSNKAKIFIAHQFPFSSSTVIFPVLVSLLLVRSPRDAHDRSTITDADRYPDPDAETESDRQIRKQAVDKDRERDTLRHHGGHRA